MTTQFDDRIVKIVLSWGDNKVTFDTSTDPKRPPMITAVGTKFVQPVQNECTVVIANLTRELRDNLCTNLTPANYADGTRKTLEVWAGRVSTGLFLRYAGDIVTAFPSQPPDIMMTIRSKTAYFLKQSLVAQSYAIAANSLSTIAAGIASNMGLKLDFQATDRNIANYSYSGSTEKQIRHLSDCGSIDAFIDDQTLVCKDKGVPLKNSVIAISEETGLVGIPELTEWGVRVRCMLSQGLRVGGTLKLTSKSNPSLNSTDDPKTAYTIYRTGFEIATRDTPFYDVVEATRFPAAFFNTVLPT